MMVNDGERNSYHRRSPTITNVRGTVISSLSRIPGCAGELNLHFQDGGDVLDTPNSLKRNHHHDQESKLKHQHQNKPPPNAITTPLQYHRQKSRTKYTTTRKPPAKHHQSHHHTRTPRTLPQILLQFCVGKSVLQEHLTGVATFHNNVLRKCLARASCKSV